MFHSTIAMFTLLATAIQGAPAIDSTPSHILPRDGITNCDDTSTTYSGTYTEGSGTYVTSDSVTHPYKFPAIRKCWYDYFITSADVALDPWTKASGDIYCSDSSPCLAQKLSASQTCQSKSTAISASVGADIEGFSLGVSVTLTTEDSKCFTATDVTACSWTDQACHTVWTQQQVLVQKGYRRQRCDWGNGDETQCMADWTVTTPTESINYGCGSGCGDSNACGNTDGTAC
ncbi:Uu.00g105470.m01.CDS01 [Anthostomella pinea]|uniref:Uu.00g105470.m01.CDS01 n=1 Tax=Anthostomella pinea TaxID=933095 RepID=A0AAI8VE05_9PEZI|nr:Uu.00g105470.m01.CDS01 [Anthostomella pinea]